MVLPLIEYTVVEHDAISSEDDKIDDRILFAEDQHHQYTAEAKERNTVKYHVAGTHVINVARYSISSIPLPLGNRYRVWGAGVQLPCRADKMGLHLPPRYGAQ